MIISEKDADMVQEMERPQEKDIKVKKPVQELQGQGLKAVRCHYTEEFQREGLPASIPKIS